MLATFVSRRACVPTEGARRCKLTEAVANHVLGHIDRNKLLTVVDGKGVPDHFGADHGGTTPRLDHLFLATRVHSVHLLAELVGYERAFF